MGLFAKIKNGIMSSAASKIATVAAAVVLVGGGVAGLAFAGVLTGAEAKVGVAAVNTFCGQSSSRNEIFGLEELVLALQEQEAEISAEVSLDAISLDELGLSGITLPNAGAHIVARTNTEDEWNAVLDIKVANTTLLTGNAYLNKEQLQVSVPKLSASVLALNYSGAEIESQMKSSYAATYLGLTEKQIETIVDYLPRQTTKVTKEEIQKKLMEILTTAYEDNLADTEFKKAGKEEIQDNNLVQKCKVYTAEMDARYFTEFLYEVTLRTKEYCKELCAAQGIDESVAEKVFNPIDNAVHQLKFAMLDTVTWTFYVYEDRLVRICGNWTIDWVDEVGSCTRPGGMQLVLAPTGNPFENMSFSIDTPIHYDNSLKKVPQVIDLYYIVETENTEDTYTETHYVDNAGEVYRVRFDYEKLAGDFVLEASGQGRKLALEGVVDELEKGSKIGLEVDGYTYVEGDYTEEQVLNVNVSLKVSETEVAPLGGTQQDVLQMTEADFKALEEEISKNLTWMLFSMMGLFQ